VTDATRADPSGSARSRIGDTPPVDQRPRTPGPTRRHAYERRLRRRSALIAAGSTAAVIAAVVLWVPTLDGWPSVRRSFFDGETFRDAFVPILKAFWLDVRVFLICSVCILGFGLLLALARSVRSPVLFPLRLFATVYTDVVRGVPVILWIFMIGFGVAGLLNRREVGAGPFKVSTLLFLGGVALVVTYSAYVSEVFRAGIEAVHETQRAGARALGLSTWQTNRHVILPQAVRKVVPPLINDMVSLQKDVGLVSFLGPIEAFRRADVLQDKLFNFTPFVVAALLFMAMSIPLTRTADVLMRRERMRMSGTAVR
jgi:polar amino acid transport system permease protein